MPEQGKGWWDTYGDDFMGAAMMYWMNQQQNERDNREPRITPVPLTPEQQWRFDEGRRLYGYSPMRDYVGSYAHQFLQGLNGPNGIGAIGQNHQWLSPHMQNQRFAGGFQFPQVDMSKLPQFWSYNRPDGTGATPPTAQRPPAGQQPPGSQIPAPGPGAPSPGPATGRPPRNNIGGTGDPNDLTNGPRMPETWGGRNVVTPGNYPGVTDPNVRNPFVGPGSPGSGRTGTGAPTPGAGGDTGGERTVFGRIADAFRAFQNATPGWMDMGITAIITAVAASAGLPPQLVAPIVRGIMGGSGQRNPTSGSGGSGSGFIPGSIAGAGGRP